MCDHVPGDGCHQLQAEADDAHRESFQYKPLEAGEIRLLRLQCSRRGGIPRKLTPCSGTLITIQLHPEIPKLHQYEAVSYVWGSEPASFELELNGSSFKIKRNLYDILRTLSANGGTRLLWVDAICINQGDVVERSSQVRLMKLIYQQAQRVLVCVGSTFYQDWSPATCGPAMVTEVIRSFAKQQRSGADYVTLLNVFEAVSGAYGSKQTEAAWPYLTQFFDESWWRRVWVRQELAASKNAVVLYGNGNVDWTDVKAVCHWMVVFRDMDAWMRSRGAVRRSGAYDGEDMEYFRQTLGTRGHLDFREMMLHARNCEADRSS